MSKHRNYLPGGGLRFLLFLLLLVLSGCSRPLGEAGPGGIEPVVPVAPEAPVPEADEQPDPNVVLTAEAGAADFVVGVGVVRIPDDEETLYSGTLVQAVKLAIDQVNETEYLGGERSMTLMFGDVPVAGEAAGFQEPSVLDSLVATIGPVLPRSSSDTAGDMAVPLALRPTAGTGVFGQDQYVDNWSFQTGLGSAEQTLQTVLLASERLALSNIALISTGLDAEEDALLVERLNAEGIDVVATGHIDEETIASDLLLQIRNQSPDAILLNAPAETAAEILLAARDVGVSADVHFIAGFGLLGPSLLELAGDAAIGLIGGVDWYLVRPIDTSEAFVEAFRQAYDVDPDAAAAKGYVAVWLLADAIRSAGAADPSIIRGSLEAIDSVETPLGSFAVPTDEGLLVTPVMLEVGDDGEISVLDGDFE